MFQFANEERSMIGEIEGRTIRLLLEMRVTIGRIDESLQSMAIRMADLTRRIERNAPTFDVVACVVYNRETRIGKLRQDRA